MTTPMIRPSSMRNLVWAVITISVLLAPSFAFAGGKGGGGQGSKNLPQETMSLNYSEIKKDYTPQKKRLAQGQHLPAVTLTNRNSKK